jgi:hypothetical protein
LIASVEYKSILHCILPPSNIIFLVVDLYLDFESRIAVSGL